MNHEQKTTGIAGKSNMQPDMAGRMSGTGAIRHRIERLKSEIRCLEALLNILDGDILTPDADEALWDLVISKK